MSLSWAIVIYSNRQLGLSGFIKRREEEKRTDCSNLLSYQNVIVDS